MHKKLPIKLITFVIVIIVGGAFIWFTSKKGEETDELGNGNETQIKETATQKTIREAEMTVRGDSMKGVAPNGSKVTLDKEAYTAKSPEKGDIIVYDYPGTADPIIKVIKGKPADTIELRQKKGSTTLWNIVINSEIVKNSAGIAYEINESGYRMLNLYVKDYKGIIPSEAYLILGDDPFGGTDSRTFGFVGKQDLMGKISEIKK